MDPRLAKKIVQSVSEHEATRTTYRKDQVIDAFRVVGVSLTPELLQPWSALDTKEPVVDALIAQQRQEDYKKRMARQGRVFPAPTESTEEVFEAPPVVESPDLSKETLTALRALAKTKGVKGYSSKSKAELIDILRT